MPGRKADLTQSDLTRCAKAMRAADVEDRRGEVERPDGTTLRIVAGKAPKADDTMDETDEMIERNT